jgi:hypothetical protein
VEPLSEDVVARELVLEQPVKSRLAAMLARTVQALIMSRL